MDEEPNGAATASTPDMTRVLDMMASQQAAMLTLMERFSPTSAERSTSSTPTSPWSRAVDLKGMLKCDEYHGEKDKFQEWKRVFYSTLDMVNPEWTKKCRAVELSLDEKVLLEGMLPQDKQDASGLYTFLLHLCKGDAALRIAAAEEFNGYEAWRLLCRAKLARSSTVALSSLMYPRFTSVDPRVNLHQWDREAARFTERFREEVPESLRRTIYVDKIAPPELHQHLLMNQSRLKTADDVKTDIEQYLEAKDQSDQARDHEGGYIAAIRHKDHDKDDGVKKKLKNKGKGGKDKNKGKGKGKDEAGKDKGKLHKGLGKDPRSEASRFGGKCNWCWRIGHKEAQCWFKKSYITWDKDGGASADKSNGKEEGDKSQDIRKYFKKTVDADGDQMMGEVGALYPDPEREHRFVMAVLAGEVQFDAYDSEDETEENH